MGFGQTVRPVTRAAIPAHGLGGPTTPNAYREPVDDTPPLVTYSTANDDGCLIVVGGHRCPHRRYHHGPCVFTVHSETGVAFVVMTRQANPGDLT